MRQLLLVIVLPALELIAAGSPHENDSDPVIQKVHNKFSAVKNIFKRDVGCPTGDNGCKLCEPGYFKKKDCTTTEKTICDKCKEGKEYTDDCNNLSKCIRCSTCDSQHGFEVDEPCNRIHNVKCTCKHNFFCNSSKHCHHCDPCTECKNGIVVTKCTRTSDTICGEKR